MHEGHHVALGNSPVRAPARRSPPSPQGPTGAHRCGAAVASIIPFQMPQLLNPQRMRLFSETALENKVCAEAEGTSKMTMERLRGPSLNTWKEPDPSYLRTGTACCFFNYAILSSELKEDDANAIVNVSGTLNYSDSFSSQGL